MILRYLIKEKVEKYLKENNINYFDVSFQWFQPIKIPNAPRLYYYGVKLIIEADQEINEDVLEGIKKLKQGIVEIECVKIGE